MIEGLRPYPEMKPSGLLWLGEVPAHWSVLRSRYCFREVDSRSATGAEAHLSMSQKLGLVPANQVAKSLVSESYFGAKLVEKDDLVLNRLKAHLGVFAYAKQPGLISPDYTVLRPKSRASVRFFEYVLKSPACRAELRTRAKGIVEGFWRLYTDDFYDIRLPVPPLDEQRLIVRFLDWHGAQTAKLVRAKKRIIALLNEEKQAIIHCAVTRGLDPNVKLRPSGIPWLGDVPDEWEVKRLKQVANIRYGLGQPPKEKPNGLPLLRATNVDHGRIVTKDMLFVDPEYVPRSRNAFLKAGDILVVRSGAYTADSAIVPYQYDGAVAGYDLVVSARFALPEFLAAVLLAPHVRTDQLIPASMRAAQPHLNAEELGSATLALPTFEMQERIVEHIDCETARLNTTIGRVEQEIALIQEYRVRLIVDLVTGKLDVRAVAATLPEVTNLEAVEEPVEDDALDESAETTDEEMAA